MKIILLVVILFITGNLYATDYYVSNSGDDSNDGLTESTSWKTLSKVSETSFSPGDIIHFKRGNVWNNQNLQIKSSGTEGNPITFTDYGTGDLPEIVAITTFDNAATWTDEGSNIWSITVNADLIGSEWDGSSDIQRLYIGGSEVLGAAKTTPEEVGTSVPDKVRFHYKKTTKQLKLYSEGNPNSLKIECAYSQYALDFVYSEEVQYIDIENLKITGGNVACVNIVAANHINLKSLDVGDKGNIGIQIAADEELISQNIIINDCTIDSRYYFDYTSAESFEGTDKTPTERGPTNGIYGKGSSNVEIKNSTFKDYTEANIHLEQTNENGEPCENYSIHNNYSSGSSLAHGGRIKIDMGTTAIEFFDNIIDGAYGYMHLRGDNNHYHHNVIKNIMNSPIIGRKTGFGITTYDEGQKATNNIYENNIIMDCENGGLHLRGESSAISKNNIFRNNILLNNGVGKLNLAIYIENYDDPVSVTDNTFENNIMYQEGWTDRLVVIYNMGLTNEQFNNFSDHGNVVSGNLRTDPLFVDIQDEDFHLQDGSPAIDAGVVTLATKDFVGNTIPYGDTNPDIGIYESGYVVGINQLSKTGEITIYPNPAGNEIFVSNVLNKEIKEISIYNITGKLVYNRIVYQRYNNDIRFDISYLKHGVYVINVQTANNNYIRKLVKE